MDLKNIQNSKYFKRTLIGLCILIAVLIVFKAGIEVGYRKAMFFSKFGDNYARNFGGPKMKMLVRDFDRNDIPGGHGANGKIVRITLPTIVVASEDATEKAIVINDATSIRRFRDIVKPTELKVDDTIVVIGTPNSNGQIEAKLIRIFPKN